jgi:hypothetical protein
MFSPTHKEKNNQEAEKYNHWEVTKAIWIQVDYVIWKIILNLPNINLIFYIL